MTWNRMIISFGVVLLMVACAKTEVDDKPTTQTAVVELGDLMITAEATGNVEPIREVEVKSKASGDILSIYVDVGDQVESGALLAEIDPRDVKNASEQSEADLEVAQARLDIARAQLERSEELLASDVISVQEHESKNLEYANARATFVKAQTNYELAQLRLGDVIIRAPMAGTILEKNVEEGQVIQSASQNVSGGTVLVIMANLEQVQVRTLVDETDMGEIRDGMRTSVIVEAYPDRVFIGKVEKIEPQAVVQQNVTMFPVIVSLDNSSRLLKPGMNAEVEIEIAEALSVLLVPNTAVVTPQEAAAAAVVLGLPEDAIDMRSMFSGMRDRSGPRGENSDNGHGRSGQPTAPESEQERPEMVRNRVSSIRGQVASGEISRDSARSILQGQRASSGDSSSSGRRAVLFVVEDSGKIEPRVVMIGLNDWDYTQVVSGVKDGEIVALVGAAQLRATQDEFLERIRSRTSPFGGR